VGGGWGWWGWGGGAGVGGGVWGGGGGGGGALGTEDGASMVETQTAGSREMGEGGKPKRESMAACSSLCDGVTP